MNKTFACMQAKERVCVSLVPHRKDNTKSPFRCYTRVQYNLRKAHLYYSRRSSLFSLGQPAEVIGDEQGHHTVWSGGWSC